MTGLNLISDLRLTFSPAGLQHPPLVLGALGLPFLQSPDGDGADGRTGPEATDGLQFESVEGRGGRVLGPGRACGGAVPLFPRCWLRRGTLESRNDTNTVKGLNQGHSNFPEVLIKLVL